MPNLSTRLKHACVNSYLLIISFEIQMILLVNYFIL